VSRFVRHIRGLDTFYRVASYQPVVPDSGLYGSRSVQRSVQLHTSYPRVRVRHGEARYCADNRGFSLFRRGAPPSPIVSPTSDRAMPALTRHRDVESRQEYWLIYYGDVHVGTIAVRSGIPHDQPEWGWRCGFYPGSLPGECTTGTAVTFEQARAVFEGAWRVFLSNRTEADFDAWRDQRDWAAERYHRFDRGELMPHDRRVCALRPIEPFSAPRDLQAYSGGPGLHARPQLLAVGGKLLAAPSFEI
jgi:hypothetical protein